MVSSPSPFPSDDDVIHVFLSYAHADNQLGDKKLIKKALEKCRKDHPDFQFGLFIDDDIPGGADWDNTLKEKLRQTALFIPCITYRYCMSNECDKEFSYFLDLIKNTKKTRYIIPVFSEKITSEMRETPGFLDDLYQKSTKLQGVEVYKIRNDQLESEHKKFNKAVSALSQKIYLAWQNSPLEQYIQKYQNVHSTQPADKTDTTTTPNLTKKHVPLKSSRKAKNLPAKLMQCHTEEEVKNEFTRAFGYKLDTRMRIDLYTPEILFEFKYKRNMASLEGRSRTIAQALYYVRRIKYGNTDLQMPIWICGIDQNEAFFVKVKSFRKIYDSNKVSFDWDRTPSSPCPNIVHAVEEMPETSDAHVYSFADPEDYANFQNALSVRRAQQLTLDIAGLDKKEINEDSFEQAFSLWNRKFGAYVQGSGHEATEYFMADIQGNAHPLENTDNVAFQLTPDTMVSRPMPMDDYRYYWNTYARLSESRFGSGRESTLRRIGQRLDRLSVEDVRRQKGEFYTPVEFAEKGLEYLTKTVGKNWWEKGYRLWDMAAGTGNLELVLPQEALPYCYISTLEQDDVDYCSTLFSQSKSTVFQYDYLRDDTHLLTGHYDILDPIIRVKMPDNLRRDLSDPDIKWIIFLNPPFATANTDKRKTAATAAAVDKLRAAKDELSKTPIREMMTEENLGETSRELFSQFLWRISREFRNRTAYLGMFSTLKYVNANNDQKLRDKVFHYRFERGFCFNSKAFYGNKEFPVGFLVWNLTKSEHLEDQTITLDIRDEDTSRIGYKTIPSVTRDNFLSKWCERPKTDHIMPPLSNALTVVEGHKDVRDKAAPGFLCSLMAKGNDFQNQRYTALLSSPYCSAGALSVTTDNFEKAMIVHAVRKIPEATWLNNRDQWMQPNIPELPPRFIADCVVWSLFADSNNTASMKDVRYNKQIYQIKNELYPFPLRLVRQWECSLLPLQNSLFAAYEDRYATTWLENHEPSLSSEARQVLSIGQDIYRLFYDKSSSLPWPQYKIALWDCGWYQIRMALKEHGDAQELLREMKAAHDALGRRILPQLTQFGFISGVEHHYSEDE